MKKYKTHQAIWYSFYSRDLYRDVARKWRGIGLRYLMLIILLAFLVPTVVATIRLNILYANPDRAENYREMKLPGSLIAVGMLLDFIEQFPTVRIENGVAVVDAPQPYSINYPNSDIPILILDTTGSTTSLLNTKAELLVTDTKLIMRDGDGKNETTRLEFSKLKEDITIDQRVLLSWLRWQPILYFPGLWIVNLVMYSVNALVFGLFGLALCKWMKIKLEYPDNIRLAAVTATPVIILEALISTLGVQIFSKPVVIYLMAHAAYLYHAVESNKK